MKRTTKQSSVILHQSLHQSQTMSCSQYMLHIMRHVDILFQNLVHGMQPAADNWWTWPHPCQPSLLTWGWWWDVLQLSWVRNGAWKRLVSYRGSTSCASRAIRFRSQWERETGEGGRNGGRERERERRWANVRKVWVSSWWAVRQLVCVQKGEKEREWRKIRELRIT